MPRRRSRLLIAPIVAAATAVTIVGPAGPADADGRDVPLEQLRVTTAEVAADLSRPTAVVNERPRRS